MPAFGVWLRTPKDFGNLCFSGPQFFVFCFFFPLYNLGREQDGTYNSSLP